MFIFLVYAIICTGLVYVFLFTRPKFLYFSILVYIFSCFHCLFVKIIHWLCRATFCLHFRTCLQSFVYKIPRELLQKNGFSLAFVPFSRLPMYESFSSFLSDLDGRRWFSFELLLHCFCQHFIDDVESLDNLGQQLSNKMSLLKIFYGARSR